MSSILKALKKLENETAHQTSLAQVVDAKKTIRRSTMGKWLFYSLISAIFTAVILIGSGWFLLRQKPMVTKLLHAVLPEEIEVGEIKKETPKPVVKTEPVIAKTSEPPKVIAPEKKSEPLPVPDKPLIIPSLDEEIIPVRPAPKQKNKIIPQTPVPPPDMPEQEDNAGDQAETPAAEENLPDPQQNNVEASDIPEKQIEGITIQALVWSETPQSRIVMINNHILHIGDALDRFYVKDIGNDYIILKDGNEQFKTMFHVR